MTGRWHLRGSPLAVQAEAMRRAEGHDRFGMWLEMGLAKTATDLHEFIEYESRGKVDAHLIICPNHLKENWLDEMERWHPSLADAPVCVWPSRDPTARDSALVVNYEAVRSSAIKVILNWMRGRNVYMTLDESQHIKTFNSATTKTVLGTLSPMAVMVRELTGTPMTQNVMDYWSQLRALGLLAGTNPYSFRNRYAVMGGYMGKQITGFKNQEELTQIIGSRVFRARTTDWQDLPERSHGVVGFEMTAAQTKMYKQMADEFLIAVRGQEVSADMVITQMLKLQQIGRGFVMSEGKVIRLFDRPSDNPSFKALAATVESRPGKTLIFTIHRAATDEVLNGLTLTGMKCAVMRGGMSMDEIRRQKSTFENDPECRTFVLQTSVAKEGHTLVGDQSSAATACTTTVYYEDSYNLGHRMQSEKRNHRQGQRYPVHQIDMVGSSIDRHIAKARARKAMTVEALVDVLRSIPGP